MRGKGLIFPVCGCGREKERRKRAPSFSLRSTELHWSDFVDLRTKVHRIDEGYVWVPRTRDFFKDPRKEIHEINIVKASYPFIYAPKGMDYFYIGLFSTFRLRKMSFFSFYV